MEKPVGKPWMWSLIPIGVFASFFGFLLGRQLIDQAGERAKLGQDSRSQRKMMNN